MQSNQAVFDRLRHWKHAMSWWRVRQKVRAAGVDIDRLTRVREFVQTRMRLQKPSYVHPLQRPTGFIQSLSSRPWHDPADFVWIPDLENAYRTIRDELLALRNSGRFLSQHDGITSGGQWNVFYLYNYGDKIEENCALCPETTRIVESIPNAVHAGRIYFSALTPGTQVAPHCGPSNTRLRVHFGLVVPENCRIRVGGETRSWAEGQCIVFDDSYEHEVSNDGPGTRIVLILDVWHPELTSAEAEAVRKVTMMRSGIRGLTQSIQNGERSIANNDWWS